MKKIPFLAIVLALFVTPVWTQKTVCADKGCQFDEYTHALNANSDAESFDRTVNYFAKNKTASLYSSEIGYSLPKAVNEKKTIISKSENLDSPAEEFAFLIQDFKINHQSEVNNLNIKIRYRYENGISDTKYPDFRAILKDIEDFLNNYPNKIDYWEILNKKLTQMVLKKYHMLKSITSEIQVSPSQSVSYLRSSTVTLNRAKRVKK